MTTDLIAAGDETIYENKRELYENWVAQKLLRDFQQDRARPAGYENTRLLLAVILDLMTEVAGKMCEQVTNRVGLKEHVNESVIRATAEATFGGPVSSDLYSVTSLLEPEQAKTLGYLRFRFFHKSFQEYFTARFIAKHGDNSLVYPPAVLEFL